MQKTVLTKSILMNTSSSLGITKLHLLATSPTLLADFYGNVLGFPILQNSEKEITIQIGNTELRFSQTAKYASPPTYHFAFNISKNKLEKAIKWANQRVEILSKAGQQIFHFKRIRAHAFYFYDPAGNIVELMAKRDLDNEARGDFGVSDILYATEIGLVVDDVLETAKKWQMKFGWGVYMPGSKDFIGIGDAYYSLIIVKKDRIWLPTLTHKAESFPVEAEVGDSRKILFF